MRKLLLSLALLIFYSVLTAQKVDRLPLLDTVHHDATLIGQGITGNDLMVDTTLYVATKTDVTNNQGLDSLKVDITLIKTGDSLRVDTTEIATPYDLTLIPSIFTNTNWDASNRASHYLYEDASGAYSTRFRSVLTNNYFTLLSDTTDSNFLGFSWVTLGGNGRIGHKTDGYHLEFGDELTIELTNSLDRIYLDATFDTDNSNTLVLARDPISNELEEVNVNVLQRGIDNVGTGDTLFIFTSPTDHMLRSLLGGDNVTLTSQDSTITINADPPLSNADQIITADRLISGSDTYDLHLDSLPLLFINGTEVFITDSLTTAANWLGASSKYQKENAGFLRINSIGQDYTAVQNTNGTDEISSLLMATSQAELKYIKEGGATDTLSSIVLDNGAVTLKQTESSTNGQLTISSSVITFSGTDSLVITNSGLGTDNTKDIFLAIDGTSGKLWKRQLSSVVATWYDAGNGAYVYATGTGVTFARTDATTGTFTIPTDVVILGSYIKHTAAQNPGTQYYIRFDGDGADTYFTANSIDDLWLPDIRVHNTFDAVGNGGTITRTVGQRMSYDATTGTTNMRLWVTSNVTYLELLIDNYNVSTAGGANDTSITIKF